MKKKQIIATLKNLQSKGAIKASDYIEYRPNDNGEIGRLVEHFFGVNENNISSPDLGTVELKATVIKSGSAITFNSSKPIAGLSTKEQYESFKQMGNDGLFRFYQTVKSKPNKSGFLLKYDSNLIKVYHKETYISSYDFDLTVKTSNVLFVFAKKIGSGSAAQYNIVEAYFASVPKNISQIILEDEDMLRIDIRCGVYKKGSQRGKLHDRGTAIRFAKNKLSSLFNTYERLI
jgi:hypothetical protein